MGWVKRVKYTEPHKCVLPKIRTVFGRQILGEGSLWECDDCGQPWGLVRCPGGSMLFEKPMLPARPPRGPEGGSSASDTPRRHYGGRFGVGAC